MKICTEWSTNPIIKASLIMQIFWNRGREKISKMTTNNMFFYNFNHEIRMFEVQ